MIESINSVIDRLEYNSLVLLYEACNDLKTYASKDLTYTEELLEHFMKDEELEQEVKYNNILERIPYDGESFAHSVKDFNTGTFTFIPSEDDATEGKHCEELKQEYETPYEESPF